MKCTQASDFAKRDRADALIIPFWEGSNESSFDSLKTVLDSKDFKGTCKEVLIVYSAELVEKRVLLLGLGKKENATEESLRRAYGSAAKALQKTKARSCNVLLPKSLPIDREKAIRGAWEGILLSNYTFNKLKGKGYKECCSLLETIGWVGLSSKELALLDRQLAILKGVYFTRDIVNDNADTVTPEYLAKTAKSLEKLNPKIQVATHDKKWLENEKMGLILAVSKGSSVDPYLLEIAYHGNPKSKKNIILVGKGVTYDTGGLSLKPSNGMLTMKCDMA